MKVAIIIKRIPTPIVLYESIGEYSNVVSKVSAVPALCPIIPPAVPNTAANPKQAKPTGIPTPVPRAAIPLLTTAPVAAPVAAPIAALVELPLLDYHQLFLPCTRTLFPNLYQLTESQTKQKYLFPYLKFYFPEQYSI